ncbi:MAG: PfkB family carbohydrate kinase [Candidatus Omnitrophica bacterium]|nr:PfkB family carbohydrate kinase [Candidatus Omnitrophota bacterium]
MSILVLGTVALDTVKTPFGRRKRILGGSAAHFSMVARLFTDVHLVGVVGKNFPKIHVDFLKKKKIVLDSLISSAGKTFEWEGEYKGDLNTAVTLRTELGVLATFKPVISNKQRKIKHVFLANVDPDIQNYFLSKVDSPQLVGLDSMNFWIEHKRSSLLRLLKKVDIYVANDQEARHLSGEHSLINAAKYLHSRGPKMILIKKGEHGAFLFSDKFIFSLPAYPIHRVIDPTGAGDTFAGGFMGYLARAKKITAEKLKKAVAYGVIAASFNVEAFGVERTHSLKIEDLDYRLKKFRDYVLF